jgi:hypothetical protein
MHASFRAAGFDVASSDGSGQVEVELRPAAGSRDGDLADMRVPRKLGK